MDRYRELEKRWLKYKIKSYFKATLLALLLIALSITGGDYLLNLYNSPKVSTNNIEEQKGSILLYENKHQKSSAKNLSREPKQPESPLIVEEMRAEEQEELIRYVKSEEECYIISANKLHIRLLPNTKSKIIGTLEQRDRICIDGRLGSWVRFAQGWSYAAGTMERIDYSLEEPKRAAQEDMEQKEPLLISQSSQEGITSSKQEEESEKVVEAFVVKKEQIGKKKMIVNLKERFDKEQRYEDAIEIAKLYYASDDYKNAEKWALIANGVDNESPESWIIFAKVKYKEGFKREAISILERYQARRYSSEVKSLLVQITNENLR